MGVRGRQGAGGPRVRLHAEPQWRGAGKGTANVLVRNNRNLDDLTGPVQVVAGGRVAVGEKSIVLLPDRSVIDYFSNGYDGQIIYVRAGGAATVHHAAGTVELADDTSFAMAAGDMLVLAQFGDGVWVEVTRTVKTA